MQRDRASRAREQVGSLVEVALGCAGTARQLTSASRVARWRALGRRIVSLGPSVVSLGRRHILRAPVGALRTS